MNVKRLINTLTIISLFVLTIGILVSWNTPCTGYEPDIYAATPTIFWIGVFLCYFTGTGILLHSTFKKPGEKYYSYLGFLQLALAAISMISVCVIRGYKLMDINGDPGTHIGRLNSVISTGSLPNTYYPSIYSEPAAISVVTGVDGWTVLQLIPLLSMVFFSLFICLIAKEVFPQRVEVCFASIIAFYIPMGSVSIFGCHNLQYSGLNIAMFILLPVVLYLLIHCLKGKKSCLIPLAILNLSISTYHPHVTVICLGVYFVAVSLSLIQYLKRSSLISKLSLIKVISLFGIMIGGFFTFTWKYFERTIMSGVSQVIDKVAGNSARPNEIPEIILPPVTPPDTVDSDAPSIDITPSVTPDVIISDSNTSMTILERLVSGINDILNIQAIDTAIEYGFVKFDFILSMGLLYFVLYGMLLVAGVLLIIKYWKRDEYFWFKFTYLSAVIMVIPMIVAVFGDVSGGPFRFRYLIYLAAVLSCGFVLNYIYVWIKRKANPVISFSTIFLIIMIIGFLGVVTYHPSPLTLNEGYQTTQTELTGSETLLPMINFDWKSTSGVHFGGMQRFVTALYNHLSLPYRDDTNYDDGLPNHFGYDKGSTSFAESIPEGEKYVIATEHDYKYYEVYHPQMMVYRFSSNDYMHLNMDTGFNYVYNNGGFETRMLRF